MQPDPAVFLLYGSANVGFGQRLAAMILIKPEGIYETRHDEWRHFGLRSPPEECRVYRIELERDGLMTPLILTKDNDPSFHRHRYRTGL